MTDIILTNEYFGFLRDKHTICKTFRSDEKLSFNVNTDHDMLWAFYWTTIPLYDGSVSIITSKGKRTLPSKYFRECTPYQITDIPFDCISDNKICCMSYSINPSGTENQGTTRSQIDISFDDEYCGSVYVVEQYS